MSGINKVILVGRLGQDPEMKYAPDGKAIANISIATSESWKDKNTGEKKEKTEWHRVVFFGPLAEIVGQYVKKGSNIYIEGKLVTRKWQDQSGADRYSTEVVVDGFGGTMQMLDSAQGNQQTAQQAPAQGRHAQQAPQQNAPAQQQPQQNQAPQRQAPPQNQQQGAHQYQAPQQQPQSVDGIPF